MGAAFFVTFLVSVLCFADAKDLVSEARQLSLKGERVIALKKLNEAHENSKYIAGRPEINQAVEQLSQLFLLEKSQKIYEKAESYYFKQNSRALGLYEQVRKMEPGNTKVIAAQVRALMGEKHCRQAVENVREGLVHSPRDLVLTELQIRALDCDDQVEEAKKLLEELQGSHLFERILRSKWAFLEGNWEEAEEYAKAAGDMDRDFPETYYLLWKVGKKLDKDKSANLSARKYISICKNATPRLRRKYRNEPHLCGKLAEVEKFIEQDG